MPFIIFANPNANTVKIADINIAEKACLMPIGTTPCNIHDDMVIAIDIPIITNGKKITVLTNPTNDNFAFLNANNSFATPNAINPNKPEINKIENALPADNIDVFDSIHDATVILNAIDVIASIKLALSLKGSNPTFLRVMCTTAKAYANNGNAIANDITVKKLTFPNNLKATPIANTAAAIANITPTPFLKLSPAFLFFPNFSTVSVSLVLLFVLLLTEFKIAD